MRIRGEKEKIYDMLMRPNLKAQIVKNCLREISATTVMACVFISSASGRPHLLGGRSMIWV